jgi:hypothetical protein
MAEAAKRSAAIVQEVPFLPSREKANPGNAIQIRQRVTDLRERLGFRRARDGEEAHELGTSLVVLYMAFAERVFERASFREFVEADLDLARSTAYRYLRVARYATRAQACWGVDVCLDAARIVEALAADAKLRAKHGLRRAPETISDLKGVAFALSDGRKVRFDGATISAVDVEALAAELVPRPAGTRLPAPLRRANARLAQAIAADPGLAGVEAAYLPRAAGHRLQIALPADGSLKKVAARLAALLEQDRED